ncbi:alpha/beta hydrolase [uncultured Acinetobacter sp.]|uniref:alpha/beta hydrolase n=1 Tax=uncultured Acinetobacter sp. TaxID=165433 RepID=UPI00260C06AC|nr:alpha/beta hydrolase [uncultured Acinetobacter sp.]
MSTWKKSLVALACSSVLFLTACNDDDKNNVSYSTYISQNAYSQDTLDAASRIDVMKYSMPHVLGQTITSSALVLTPKTPKPKEGWRVVVWNHGTVGSGDQCAPSKNNLHPDFKAIADVLLDAGYVVIAPDYEGLGEKGIHPYLHSESAANTAIYAQKAYQERYAAQGAWMSVGHSQGGHASLAIAEYAQTDSNYLGAVAAAPASSLGFIIKHIAPQLLNKVMLDESLGVYPAGTAAMGYADLLSFAAYVTTGIQAYDTRFDYKTVFESRSQPIVDAALGSTGDNGLCLNDLRTSFAQDISHYVAENPGKNVLDYPALIQNFDENQEIAEFLATNQPATRYIAKPVMIVQGTLDAAVPYVVTKQLADHLALQGTQVQWEEVEGGVHSNVISLSKQQILEFVQQQMPAR